MEETYIPNELIADFLKGQQSWDDLTKSVDTIKVLSAPGLTPTAIADLFAEMERQDIRVDTVLTNAVTYSEMRKWSRDILDIETRKEALQKGKMGMVWGADIIVDKGVPDKTVMILSEASYKTAVQMHLDNVDLHDNIDHLLEQAKMAMNSLAGFLNKLEAEVRRAQIKEKNPDETA